MKNLFLFFTFANSLEDWFSNGSVYREIDYYQSLVKYFGFGKVYWATYGERDYKFIQKIPKEIVILPKKLHLPNLIYSLIIPFLYKKEIKSSLLIKTNQILGAWSAILARVIYQKPLFLRSGYTLSLSTYEDGGFKEKVKKLLFFLLESIAYLSSDIATVTSQTQKRYLVKKYKLDDKVLVLPNPINTAIFKPIKLKRKLRKRIIKILFVGRLNRVKNLRAFLLALRSIDNVSLDIVGKGEEEKFLKNYARKNRIKVNFLGVVRNNDLPTIYNQYDIYTQVSFWEGNPKTILEAMACGLPCLCSNVRGINEVIRHNYNGWLVGTDSDNIRKGIIKLMSDKKLREKLSKNARETIEKQYSLERVLKKEINLYNQLIHFKND